jgi:long-chain acyl-CoA synthetase
MNIFDSLERARIGSPNQPAIAFKDQEITYGELCDGACRFSAALAGRLAVQRGDRVALFMPNIPEFVICYFAVQRLGAIAVSLNVMLKRDEVEFVLRDCDAALIVTTAQLVDRVPPQVASLRGIVVVGESEQHCLRYAELMAERPAADSACARVEDDDGAAILYTSGTTGKPKGVLLTHSNLRFNSAAVNRYTHMTAADRLLCFLPLFHCFGQNFIMNGAVNARATLILHERFLPDEVLQSALVNEATMFLAVPAVYARLLTQPGCEKYLQHVRYYFTAAAAMPAEVARRWRERFGKTIYEGYGLTETSPFASYNHESAYRDGSVGTALAGVEITTLGQNGERLAPGEIGEIAIKGPNVMKGYFNRPEETAEVLRDGWFLTGDIGKIDQDGYVFLVDRAKDMVNISGFKVWPREIEEILSRHDGVIEAAVIGIPDAISGEAVKAFVVLKQSAQVTDQDIINFCRERIAVYKAPRSVEFIDALPRNPSGKVLKRELRLRELNARKVA